MEEEAEDGCVVVVPGGADIFDENGEQSLEKQWKTVARGFQKMFKLVNLNSEVVDIGEKGFLREKGFRFGTFFPAQKQLVRFALARGCGGVCLSLSLSLSLSFFLSSLSLSFFLFSLSFFLSLALSVFLLSLSLSLSLSHTHTHTHTHSLSLMCGC